MHKIDLISTDASTPETVAATTTLKVDGKEITGVRSFKLLWEQNALPQVLIEFCPGEVEINTGADTTLTLSKAQFAGDRIEAKAAQT
jgi:hypothetical protein